MSSYWQDRAEQRLLSAEEKALRLEEKLKPRFNQVYENIEEEFAKFYFEFADENGLDYGAAKKKLTAKEKETFRRDLEYRIEKAENEESKKRLEERYKGVTTRLEAKKLSIEEAVHGLYLEYFDTEMQLMLADVLDEGYYRTIFDMQQFIGVGVAFATLSPHILTSLLDYPWSGKNYSEKIWGHVNGFSGKLEDILTVGIVQGKSNQKMARELAKACDVEYRKAIALIRTETNFIANEAASKGYEELGVDKYRYLATLDLKTSPQCRELDGKIFEIKDKKAGINYPPLHTHCRSTTVPEIDEVIEGTRIARKADGSTYKVDRNMTYKQWYDKHVAGNQTEQMGEKKIKNKSFDKKQYEKYKETLGSEAPKSFEAFRKMKYNNANEYSDLKTNYRALNHIRSDKQKKDILEGRQNKHMQGTNEYKQYVKNLSEKNQYGPSVLNISLAEAQELVRRFAGTGKLEIKGGKFIGTERISTNKKVVGTVVNNLNGKTIETTAFKIHYSSKGVHIVPDYPRKGR